MGVFVYCSVALKNFFVTSLLAIANMVELKYSPLPSWLLQILLLAAATVIKAKVTISLESTSNDTMNYTNYSYEPFYDNSFSNFNGFQMEGFLYQPKDSCTIIPPIPNYSNSTHSWIAVINNTECFSDTVEYVKDAGFVLIIVAFNSPAHAKQYDFPIVVISTDYLDYLIETVLSDFSDPDILATVDANNIGFIVVIFVISVFAIALCTFVILSLVCAKGSCKCRVFSFQPSSGLYHNYNNHQEFTLTQSNNFDQELTASTTSSQCPLESERINQLSTNRYEKGSTTEQCTICMDELKDGDTRRLLPCGHNTFHRHCIDGWLKKKKRSCPLCRHNVTKEKPKPPVKAREDLSNDEDDDEMGSNIPLVSGQERHYSSTSASVV